MRLIDANALIAELEEVRERINQNDRINSRDVCAGIDSAIVRIERQPTIKSSLSKEEKEFLKEAFEKAGKAIKKED